MKLLTLARDLRRRRARERHRLFVAEGVRAVDELLRSSVRVRGVLASRDLAPEARALLGAAAERRAIPLLEVEEREFASAADTDSPQGVLAMQTFRKEPMQAPTRKTRSASGSGDGIGGGVTVTVEVRRAGSRSRPRR